MFNIKLIVTVPKKTVLLLLFVTLRSFTISIFHLLLNRYDVKLKPVLTDCFVFASLGSGFMHLPKHFLVVVVICTWLLMLSPLKKRGESYSFAIAFKWIWRFFYITLIRWVAPRTYSGPWTTMTLTFALVFVLWNSAKNSPCKVNVFTKRYTVFVK